MKKYNNEQSMVNYMSSEFSTESEITIVTSLDNIEEILNDIEFDYKSLTKTIKEDSYTYSLEKYTIENSEVHIYVEALEFDENGNLENYIDGETIIVEDDLLEKDDFQMLCTDNLQVVDYESEYDLNSNDDYSDKECQCETCVEAREIEKQETNSDNCLHDCRFCNCCDTEEEDTEDDEEQDDLSEDC